MKALHFLPRDHSAALDLGASHPLSLLSLYLHPSSPSSPGHLLPWLHLLSRHEALLLSTHQLPSLFSCFYTNCPSLFQPLAATLGWTWYPRMLLGLSRGTACPLIASAMPKACPTSNPTLSFNLQSCRDPSFFHPCSPARQ